MMAATVEGTTATISLKEGVVMVDNATVSTADIMASNGVIHIIDTVILPPSIKNAMYSDVKM
jgi:uncharacterized surface protein with fasciclin (FAS1) repeats